MAIKIVQLLCPNGHSVVSGLFDSEQTSGSDVILQMVSEMGEQHIEPKCEQCGSTELHWEEDATKFQTLEEAGRVSRKEEARQKLILRIFGTDRQRKKQKWN